MSEISTPIDLSKILETIKKLKSALLEGNVLNTSLVKKNNSLQIELSFMPEEMRERIRGAPFKRENQRKDPHYLIPDGNRFVFQRADPNDRNVSELQTCGYYHSIGHLLKEADDIMRIIDPRDTQSDVDQESDHGDQGSNAQGASFNAPPTAPSAQIATNDGEQKGVNKRSHDTMVGPGHKTNSSRTQRMGETDSDSQSSSTAPNVANLPALQSVVSFNGKNQKRDSRCCCTSKAKLTEHSSCAGNYRHRTSDGPRRPHTSGNRAASSCTSNSSEFDIR